MRKIINMTKYPGAAEIGLTVVTFVMVALILVRLLGP
jgi:hypothetical protein